MISVMPDKGGFGEIDCSRSDPKQGRFLRRDNFRSFAAPGKGRSRAARRVKRSRLQKAVATRPVSFSHRTSRRSRCVAPPAPEPAPPWLQPAAGLGAGAGKGCTFFEKTTCPPSCRRPGAQLRSEEGGVGERGEFRGGRDL